MIVHWKHYLDGWPLCWDQDEIGSFEGTKEQSEVTCPDCKTELEIE